MRKKIIAALGAFMLSAGAMQAQNPATPTKPIDINTASRTELADAGWGQYADAIIAARPYKSMNDLVAKNVVPATAYEKGANRFIIGDGTTPLSDPSQSPLQNPTSTNPPSATPPTVAPGTTPPTATPPQTGTTPPSVPQPGATPPSVQPGATSPTPGSPAPAATSPGAATSPAK